MKSSFVLMSAATVGLTGAAAMGAFDNTMYSVGSIGGFSTEIFQATSVAFNKSQAPFNSTVDVPAYRQPFTAQPYNYPVPPNALELPGLPDIGVTRSGHQLIVGPNVVDQTSVISRVHRVTQATNLGGLTLNPNDLIFSYDIRLVADGGATTVQSLQEVIFGGLDESAFGGAAPGGFAPQWTNWDPMLESMVKGRGFVTPGAGVATPIAQAGDFTDLGAFGSLLDFVWDDTDLNAQLDNSESIRLLIFAEPSAFIANGYMDLISGPSNTEADVYDVANFIPILIPGLPGPGSLGLLAIAGLAASRRRRGNA